LFQPSNIKKVLLVEDNQRLREDLAVFLGDAGCEVTDAADAVSAIRQIEANNFDVVLLDIILSNNKNDLQGIDFLDSLKALKRSTPVILLTNKADNATTSEVISAGAGNVRSFLTKSNLFSQNVLYLIEQAVHSPLKTRRLFELLGTGKPLSVVRGVSADLHFRLQEYIAHFPEYMRALDGRQVEVQPLSYLDDLFVELNAPGDAASVQAHFETYLSYPLQYPKVDLAVEVSGEKSAAFEAEFRTLTKNLVDEIARSVDVQSVPRECLVFPASGDNVRIFEYNTWKIHANKFASDLARPSVVREFEKVRRSCEYLIGQNNTAKALAEIAAFCKANNWQHLAAAQLMLGNRLEAVRNAHIQGLIDLAESDRQIWDINLQILDLLFEVESAVKPDETGAPMA
jgi:CheY-like chemotaxis protein